MATLLSKALFTINYKLQIRNVNSYGLWITEIKNGKVGFSRVNTFFMKNLERERKTEREKLRNEM